MSDFSTYSREFQRFLEVRGLELARAAAPAILQVNVGLLCNLACRHCHLEAGPFRPEVMGPETVAQVIAFARKFRFGVIDLTGGAPEMNPHIAELIAELAPLTPRLMLRSNLVAIQAAARDDLLDLCRAHQVVIAASFPSLNAAQLESQRGSGVFLPSLAVLKRLNEFGYGRPGTGLELNLVANPAGAFIPSGQQQLEKRFHQLLAEKHGIEFNNLFAFANVPLGRFRKWLETTGNYQSYLATLRQQFNPCSLAGVMCRTLVSVSWDGYLYDCDFNQALALPLGGLRTHLSEIEDLPGAGAAIAVSDHCFACVAGSGFT